LADRARRDAWRVGEPAFGGAVDRISTASSNAFLGRAFVTDEGGPVEFYLETANEMRNE